jgi:GNAT superfamily N-acetyltransferase
VLKYEPVQKSNVLQAIAIQNSIFPEENGAFDILSSLNKTLFLEVYPEFHDNITSMYWLPCLSGDPVGIVGFYQYDDNPSEIWVGWYGVLEKYRGKGFGGEILDFAEKKATEMGIKILRLHTDSKTNATAVKLYEKRGFVGLQYEASASGVIVDDLIYSKALGNYKIPPVKGTLNIFKDIALQHLPKKVVLNIQEYFLSLVED